MTSQAHVEALSKKHQVLEDTIAREMQRPTPDQIRLTELKRRKLRLKEEMQMARRH